jgi:hypothetical protein
MLKPPVRRHRPRVGLARLAVGLALIAAPHSRAASLSGRDVHIIAKALGFLDPAPSGGTVAVVYASFDAASKADADAVVALFADGLAVGGRTVSAKAVDVARLGRGDVYVALIAALGVQGGALMDAAKARKIPCITSVTAMVQAGQCLVAVHSEPQVDITVNRAATQSVGIHFNAAFGMLVHEI